MSIFAIGSTKDHTYVVRTGVGQTQFTIRGVAPGTYVIVGFANDGPNSAGGWTEFDKCGEQASCMDHTPLPVKVMPGKETKGIGVADWYAKQGSLPAMPMSEEVTDQTRLDLCGDPTVDCKTSFKFPPSDLPLAIPDKPPVLNRAYASKWFYVVVLKEIPASDPTGCQVVAESERSLAQKTFPKRKVFTTRHHCDDQREALTGVPLQSNVLAVYAGATEADAKTVLGEVRVTAKYPTAALVRTTLNFSVPTN
jgi:hypothetical protein